MDASRDPPVVWAPATASPVPLTGAPEDPLAREALSRCGEGEDGLAGAAALVVSREGLGEPVPDAEALASAQRAAGEPHPWARAWAASAPSLAPASTLARLDAWLAEDCDPALRRCAVATGPGPDGTRVLAVVAVDALADLAALPTRARTGQWLEVRARLRVRATGGLVVVLGPGGTSRRVPAWFDGATLSARFALDRPGAFDVQVLAATASGPRPVAEARVFADVEPDDEPPAPGEDGADAADPSQPDDVQMRAMLAAARATAGEPPLARDPRLDALARRHAERMAASRVLAHDAGDGDPVDRLAGAGLSAREIGENVAHAATPLLAHRALWASPSHRANLLARGYDRVGIAVVRDARGEAWVVEAFAGGLR